MIVRFTRIMLVGYSDFGVDYLPESIPVIDADSIGDDDTQIGIARNLEWVDDDCVRAEITVREEFSDREFEVYLCEDENGPAVWAF